MNVLDLFCGCGGMSKGLSDAGLNIVAGIDKWDKAIENYKKNFHHQGICEDITKLPPALFQSTYNKDNITIDFIVGGPPCQGFSIAGRRKTNDPRNSLFMEYVKYLNYFKPRGFLMENVMGILSMKTETGVSCMNIIMEHFTVDYNCIIMKLYASDFEVPQNRRRVIIFGIRRDIGIIPYQPDIVSINKIAVKTILLPEDQIEKSYFLSERAITGLNNKKKNSKANGCGFGAQFLDPEKPSYTIPARYWKDGYDALVKYSESSIRRLTIVELKRIQTFPDSYVLDGSKKDVIMQIGNAVACKFAYHLGNHILKSFNTRVVFTPPEPLEHALCKYIYKKGKNIGKLCGKTQCKKH